MKMPFTFGAALLICAVFASPATAQNVTADIDDIEQVIRAEGMQTKT